MDICQWVKKKLLDWEKVTHWIIISLLKVTNTWYLTSDSFSSSFIWEYFLHFSLIGAFPHCCCRELQERISSLISFSPVSVPSSQRVFPPSPSPSFLFVFFFTLKQSLGDGKSGAPSFYLFTLLFLLSFLLFIFRHMYLLMGKSKVTLHLLGKEVGPRLPIKATIGS